jgi:4-hydroxyphenylpyruvate dioxygenase
MTHGTSVCDIGLKVEDAAATVQRARVLGAEPFEQPAGPGELKIPAIRGIGGGVIHFIDSKSDLQNVWEIEFEKSDEEQTTRDGGLTTIDHVAQTMNYEEMLTWMLFYTTIFKTRKTPMVDVVDPAGLVRSQVIENEEGSLRFTLNGAENRRTLAGRFISESFGSAVQHLAFATDDIFATARAIADNGFKPLTISPNYYDDLDARFGLDGEFLDRLRAENILYDRDEDGEYFQLYSPSYGEGFFFEIIERRGPYKGYGAANAQFRIAAQKRTLNPKLV